MDPRIVKLADLLVDYSCRVQAGDKVLIDYEGDCCKDLVRQLIKKIYAKGGLPYVDIRDSAVTRELLLSCSEEQITFMNECSLQKMKGMQAYIAIRAGGNTAELSDVPSDKLNMYYRLTSPTLDYRVNETKWVVLRYPNNSMAQLANTRSPSTPRAAAFPRKYEIKIAPQNPSVPRNNGLRIMLPLSHQARDLKSS